MSNYADIVPKPCGKLTPSLAGSHSYNTDSTPDWLTFCCPNCGSDNVCCLNLAEYPEGRWLCFSCSESWVYGLEDA